MMKAMKLLCSADREHDLCAYSLTPMDATMQFDIATIGRMLAPGVADIVARIFTQPADFHKEFTAVHTWQCVARKQAAAAYDVRYPRISSQWLPALCSFIAELTCRFAIANRISHLRHDLSRL